MKDRTIEWRSIDDIIPYDLNPRKNDSAVEAVANSIQEFGFNQPIAVDKDGVVVVGHTRLKAAEKLGMKKVPVVVLDDLTDEQCKAYRLADNKTNELSIWDDELLVGELADISLDMSKFGFVADAMEDIRAEGELDSKYSQKMGEIIYEPKETHWQPEDLYQFDENMIDEINQSSVPEGIKKLMCIRASLFADMNFSRIADYYAYQATAEEQRLMEKLGMVLLDRDKMVENGFAHLVESIKTIGEDENDEL